MTKVLLTAARVAKIFQVSKSHINIKVKKEILPPVKARRVIRFDEDEIAAFTQAHTTFPKGERSGHG